MSTYHVPAKVPSNCHDVVSPMLVRTTPMSVLMDNPSINAAKNLVQRIVLWQAYSAASVLSCCVLAGLAILVSWCVVCFGVLMCCAFNCMCKCVYCELWCQVRLLAACCLHCGKLASDASANWMTTLVLIVPAVVAIKRTLDMWWLCISMTLIVIWAAIQCTGDGWQLRVLYY